MAENAGGWGMRGATARQPDCPQSLSTVQWTHEEPGKVFRGSRAPQAPRFETSISQKSTVDAGGTPVRPQTDHLRSSWKSAPGPSIASVNTWRYQFSSTSRNGAGGRVPEGACRQEVPKVVSVSSMVHCFRSVRAAFPSMCSVSVILPGEQTGE
jgi:hypothetical protein